MLVGTEQGFDVQALVVVSACLAVWGLVSSRLQRLNVSAPIAFVLMGLAMTHGPWPLVTVGLKSSTLRSVAEIALALVLFADASRVNVRALRSDAGLPSRLLGIGLPLTIGVGAIAAAVIFPGVGWWTAALLGAIVAPTDAALGATIMTDLRIPSGIRRLLNVESGLNDGIATPFVNFFLAAAVATEAVHGGGLTRPLVELLGGTAIGIAVGLIGGYAVRSSLRARWSDVPISSLTVLALALLAYSAAIMAGVNGFVAAFVAGMSFGTVTHGLDEVKAFTEDAGTLMSWLVWFAFGAIMIVPGFEVATWGEVLFALLALTVVRMGPVAVSLLGSGLRPTTVGFIGWFGPRGLATVVFGLLSIDELATPESNVVLGVVTVTVTLSVLAHGISANPLASRLGPRMSGTSPERPEHTTAPALRTRSLPGRGLGRATTPRSTAHEESERDASS